MLIQQMKIDTLLYIMLLQYRYSKSFNRKWSKPFVKNKDGRTPRDLTTNDSIKNLLKEAEEKQLKKVNEEKSELTQNNTEGDNGDIKHLLGKTEPTSAAKKEFLLVAWL
ncbi:MAG: hypothetical protein ACR5K6_05860 [Wolbachia sp.]